jgi:peptidoglycan/LPS O-acetylase OafA/YrhL
LFCLSLAWRLGLEGLSSPDGLNLYARLAKQLPGQLCFFVGGAWAFYRAREGGRTYFLPAVAGVLAYNLLSGMAAIAIAPLAVTAIVTWAALAAPRLPALGRHGDFSYGIYLYHFPIVQTCIAAGLFAWSAGLAVGLIAVLVLACSVVSWFVIESPALAGRSRHVAGPPTRPQSSCTS